MIKDRGILFRGYETEQKQKTSLLKVNFPLVKRSTEEREAAKHLLPAACQIILNLETYSFCFLFFYTKSEPIPSPLGKAKEKAETTQLVLADAIPADGNCLFPFLFVLFVFLQID